MATEATEAPTQDAIAESLLGEPEQQVAEQPGVEQQVEEQVQEQPLEQQEEVQQEEVENWLPTEQDKTFPDEVLSRYAQRYGINEEALADPQLRQLVVDKINSDIFIEQQRQFAEQQPVEEPAEVQQAEQPQLTREQYFQNLDRVVQERTDPEVAKQFHADFLRAFGVPDAEIAKTSPQQAMAFTHTASKYMLNLMNTFMGDMLGAQLSQQIAQAFPGFEKMYERTLYSSAWEQVRTSNPQFSKLPAYAGKGSDFNKLMRSTAAKIPGFDGIQFVGQDGRPLPPDENAIQKYTMLAQMASSGNVNPQLLQQAAAAGARNARRADVRRAAGNLGSGQSKGASQSAPSSRFQTNSDLFDENTMDLYEREHGRL